VKFLIDNALPPRVAELLVSMGHDAVHVRSYGMHASSDIEILQRARQESRVIPSFILFRKPNLLRAEDYINLLTPVLQALEPELAGGRVAVFRDERLRVRKLPFSD
jgi:hypothetical protein